MFPCAIISNEAKKGAVDQSPPRQYLKTNLKAVGLSDELKKLVEDIVYVEKDESLECVLKLNKQV